MAIQKRNHRGLLQLPDGAHLPYLILGRGEIPIVTIPGAGDGLSTVYDGAIQLRLFYTARARRYRMLVLSRRQPIPAGFSVEQHAADMLYAVDKLGWPPSVLELNSAGGPIGQVMAVKNPQQVPGLILSVTLHRTAEQTRQVIEHWLGLADAGRWSEFSWDSIARTFRPQTVARYRYMRSLLGLVARPKDPERVKNLLSTLLELDNSPILPQIACPALVIGGEEDQVVPAEVQREMASLIPNSKLKLYPGYGHGNDQENPDYQRQVDHFIASVC
jgi:pimeloyl-ACP methyl ester carboxylesterase